MKVLLRKYGGKYYVWKTAKYENGQYIITNDDGTKATVYQTEILATKEDNRKNYVQCNNCGALVKNTPEDLEKHYAKREAERNCLTCAHMATYGGSRNMKTKYVKNADGSYHGTTTFDTNLRCKKAGGWFGYVDINHQDAERACVYNRCRSSGTSEINDIFVQYPDVFDKQITVDALVRNKYQCTNSGENGFEYDLKCRGTLIAHVNEFGIVDYFVITYRGDVYYMYYSAKYDVLYWADGGNYRADKPYELPHSKYEHAKEKISALYKEASK